MGRTKPVVLQFTRKSAGTGSKKVLGVKSYNPRELARANLTPTERERVAASLEEAKRLKPGASGLLKLCNALESNPSGLQRESQDVSNVNPERVAADKKATKTEQERNAAKLAIDGTALLDPRKADPDGFGAGVPDGMRTLRSKGKQNVDVGGVENTIIPARDAGGALDTRNHAKEQETASEDAELPINADVEPEVDLVEVESELSDVPSNISAPTPARKPTPEADTNILTASHDGGPAQSTVPPVTSNDPSASFTATPNTAGKRRPRHEVELETSGTPFVQETITAPGAFFVKQYSGDGKKWWSVPETEKPDWAVYERDVDIRRDGIKGEDDTMMSKSGRVVKKRKLD